MIIFFIKLVTVLLISLRIVNFSNILNGIDNDKNNNNNNNNNDIINKNDNNNNNNYYNSILYKTSNTSPNISLTMIILVMFLMRC